MTMGCICTDLRVWTLALVTWLALGCGSSQTTVGSGDAAQAGVDGMGGVLDGPTGLDASLEDGALALEDGSRIDAFLRADVPGDISVGSDDDGRVATGPSHCASASVLPLEAGEVFLGSDDDPEANLPTCNGEGPMSEIVEWIEILAGPSGEDIEITATAGIPLMGNPMISVYSECPPMTCVAHSDNPLGLATFSVRFTPIPYHRYYVAIGSGSGMMGYNVTIREIDTDSPANGDCSSARTISNDTYLHDENLEDAVDPTAACGLGEYASLFYAAQIGAGETLHVIATIQDVGSAHGPALRLASSCGATMCLTEGIQGTMAPSGYNQQSTLDWSNSTGADQAVILAVASDTGPYRFDLSVQIGPSP